MSPITIDAHFIDDKALIKQVSTECPTATLREISRAALYGATDVSRQDVRIAARLYYFAVNVRRAA
jgi:hypothetical protein